MISYQGLVRTFPSCRSGGGGLIQLTKLNDGRTRMAMAARLPCWLLLPATILTPMEPNIAQCLSTEIDPVCAIEGVANARKGNAANAIFRHSAPDFAIFSA
ncbi:hypothetical protein JC965_08245 [Aeromonas caviae]|uniref:Uncharacterized protein n=1 Tax=Aeromonas caviae TaxID=648 RepID=A0A7T4C5P9_AERCA|nr:hypothetical protein [Aeromonas caviae]QQA63433.2 hypothetical protein JC965_24590 [Aeromonas caviae]QQA63436.2 hypothetical protein JC965_08245 [Aeromonas caviae]